MCQLCFCSMVGNLLKLNLCFLISRLKMLLARLHAVLWKLCLTGGSENSAIHNDTGRFCPESSLG